MMARSWREMMATDRGMLACMMFCHSLYTGIFPGHEITSFMRLYVTDHMFSLILISGPRLNIRKDVLS